MDRDIAQIVLGLYIGNVEAASDLGLLMRLRITGIVNAAKELPNYFPYRFHYISMNYDDISKQRLNKDALERAYDFIWNELDQGGAVLVHCHAGVSRSASIVLYYLMMQYGLDFDQALNYVRRVRGYTKANPNPSFAAQLRAIRV